MKKLLALVLSLVMLLALLAGCGGNNSTSDGNQPAGNSSNSGDTSDPGNSGDTGSTSGDTGSTSGGTVILQSLGDPMSFCPNYSDDNFYLAAQNAFNRLVKLDASSNVVPDLAESWEYSEDGLALTFHLVENAKWHDGEPVTAEDVKYTFEYIRDHDTLPLSYNMGVVDNIEVVDDHTAVFHMNAVDMSLVSTLSWYGCFVLPKHIYDNGQDWSENEATTTHPIGSGPFKFVDFTTGVGMTLEANPDYHEGAPSLDKIIISIIPDNATALQSLLSGELDWITAVPANMVDQVSSNPDIQLSLNSLPSPTRIVFNLSNESLADLAVRQAIARCIDREDISQKVQNGIYPVEYSALSSMLWASNTADTFPKFNLEEAEQILIDAGYTKDADGYYVRGLTIDTFDADGNPDTARLIAANCEAIGIEMTPAIYDYNAWVQMIEVDKSFCIELQGGMLGPDPSALAPRLSPEGWANVGGYYNERVIELLALGAAETDQAVRKEYYDEIQKIMVEELPLINIMNYSVYEGSNARLRNLPMDGVDKWGWAEWSKAYFAD